MTKSTAAFFAYVLIGGIGVLFAILMLALASPIFSLPTERPATSYHRGGA